MNELKQLAEFICEYKFEDVTIDILNATKKCVIDSMGVAIGAAKYEEIPNIVVNILEVSGSDMEHNAQVWGSNRNTSIMQATLLNGIMAHALELDDVHTDSKTHIGAVVLPAAWTLSDALNANGEEFLEAVVVGYEVMARVGKGFGVSSHRKKGWHVTGTAGTFGSAAACAKLLKLDINKTINALGMAGTQSSGLWAFLEDGATSKKLHTGRAATNGLIAAYMAKSGMTGPENILTAKDGGLYEATSDKYNLEDVIMDIGTKFELKYMDIKPYPCCRSTHCAIDASLSIKKDNTLYIHNIKSIIVETYDIGVVQCGCSSYPTKASAAKFSTAFTVASALIDGEVTLKQFETISINRNIVKNLAKKVKVISSAYFTHKYPNHWGCVLKVILEDDTTFTKIINDATGSILKPINEQQLANKFLSLSVPILGIKKSHNLLNDIKNMENLSVLPKI